MVRFGRGEQRGMNGEDEGVCLHHWISRVARTVAVRCSDTCKAVKIGRRERSDEKCQLGEAHSP